AYVYFYLLRLRPSIPSLFPYTTLFRSAVIEALSGGAQAVVPVLPLADTVKQVDADGVVTGTPDRSSLRAVQTPQGFAEPLLRRRSEEHTSELQSRENLVCRLLLEKKKN